MLFFFSADRSKAILLLQFFCVCIKVIITVPLCPVIVHFLSFIFSSVCTLGRLCFVNLALPGYLLYFENHNEVMLDCFE